MKNKTKIVSYLFARVNKERKEAKRNKGIGNIMYKELNHIINFKS